MAYFLYIIQIEPIILAIVKHTWSIEVLDFLLLAINVFENRSQLHKTYLTFNPKIVRDAIYIQKSMARDLAMDIYNSHNRLYYRLATLSIIIAQFKDILCVL